MELSEAQNQCQLVKDILGSLSDELGAVDTELLGDLMSGCTACQQRLMVHLQSSDLPEPVMSKHFSSVLRCGTCHRITNGCMSV